MELDVSSQEDYYLKKHLFNLKTHRSDGLILQVHHSHSNSEKENKKYRFIYASFNSHGTHLAVSDHVGHVFIINLEMERYWQLPQVGLPTVISFPFLQKQELLLGLDNTSIVFVHIETGIITNILYGHTVPAAEVSYSDDGYYYLTSCSAEAIVWDSSTFTQIHRLSLKLDVYLKKVLFMPVTNHILACFQDDTMHVWKFGSFECVKQIVPETWKTHHLKSIAITKNGRAMIIGGQSSNLVIFCLDTWTVKKVVEFPDNISGVKQLEFLSQVFDGGSNKILIVLTVSQEILFFDIETLIFVKRLHKINGLVAKFTIPYNGKYLASVLTSGEVNIYIIEKVLWSRRHSVEEENIFHHTPASRNNSTNSKRTQKTYESLSSVQKEIKEVLDVKKLLPILKQFGEYPQSYRTLIWKTILKLPENQESFVSLSLKKCHPSYSNLELKYPLANKPLCNSLKKLLSNLSYWCPLFGEVDFLPEFVFPFVKLFHSSPLICFEVVATVIVNWCQNWFEFYPFPPINLLSLLESILGYHDPDLLEFYLSNNVTSSVSVCSLFHTAFSEVLSKTEWLKLWDHILSNEPSFFFMAIIAYNVVCQNTIKNLQGLDEIEKFFHTQNPVDVKIVISKAYQFLKKTPDDIHTRQFFVPFRSMGSGGTYISFIAYPKLIIDSSAEKLQVIREEEEKILSEQLKAVNIKKTLESKLNQDSAVEDKEKIYEELEAKIRRTVDEEEDRLLAERQKLQNLRQELKLKELEVLQSTRDKALNEKIKRKEIEFERLLKDIWKRKCREKVEVDTIEKEIRNYYSDLLLRKCQLEMELSMNNSENDVGKDLENQREKLKNDLEKFQYEWDYSFQDKRIDVGHKITVIKGLISEVETEIAKQMAKKNFEEHVKKNQFFVEELKTKVNSLEGEVEKLLQENLNKLQSKKDELKSADPQSSTNEVLRRKPEKKSMNSKLDPKATGTFKIGKNPKCIAKKLSSQTRANNKKVTKSKDTGNKKQSTELPQEEWNHFIKTVDSKLRTIKPLSPHLKSRFTQLVESQHHNLDSPEYLESYCQEEHCENCKLKKFHQQPHGDSSSKGKLSTFPKRLENKETENGFHNNDIKDDGLTDNTDDIFISALRTRNQIIEDAQKQHRLNGCY